MKRYLYIRLLRLFTFAWLLHTCAAYAQDTTHLPVVDVTVSKFVLSEIGKKTDKLDSATRQFFSGASVGDALSLNSSVYIKNYGPGALSSSALRGGNASQTAVLWNGFNIQNTMLGQIDLTLLPTVLFEEVNVEYGGSSSLWGTGAVAGSIHLLNKPVFNKGLTTKVNLNTGSFGMFSASTGIIISKQKFFSSTKAYLKNAVNNYKYIDTLAKENAVQVLKHASYSFKGIMQEFKFLLNAKQSLAVNLWYNKGERQIPSFNLNKIDKAYQLDDNFKSTVNWNYISGKLNTMIKGAYFYDAIRYIDSLASINSNSSIQNFIFENENQIAWNRHNRINFGVNATSSSAFTKDYHGDKSLSKLSFLLGNKFSFADEKLIIYPAVRAEYFSTGVLPVTGNVSFEYNVVKSLNAKLNVAKVYRQPTLNELYWQPGGNINLKPEQGITYEGDLNFNKKINRFFFYISGSAFYRLIDNWILWLPGPNASPTPVNIQRVWSRGTETKTKIEYSTGDFKMSVNVISAYVLSTVKKSLQENDNTEDKQLIYTPRYTINSNFSVAYANLVVTYYHQYVGYRYTTSDNTQWLTPYHYSSVRLSYSTLLKGETKISVFGACNNILNTNYTVVAGRYMPLRNFEIGISLTNNKPNKVNK